MRSGLEGRNNRPNQRPALRTRHVSMKSGLEGRNNSLIDRLSAVMPPVSMKSGLEGRNNYWWQRYVWDRIRTGLNEVRPRRPEQFSAHDARLPRRSAVSMKSGLEGRNNEYALYTNGAQSYVSMKSGLEGRNNGWLPFAPVGRPPCLNEVRPRRPEQFVFFFPRAQLGGVSQ